MLPRLLIGSEGSFKREVPDVCFSLELTAIKLVQRVLFHAVLLDIAEVLVLLRDRVLAAVLQADRQVVGKRPTNRYCMTTLSIFITSDIIWVKAILSAKIIRRPVTCRIVGGDMTFPLFFICLFQLVGDDTSLEVTVLCRCIAVDDCRLAEELCGNKNGLGM